MPEDHPHTIRRPIIKYHTKLNYLFCKAELFTITLLCLALFILKTKTAKPFARNEWLANKIKVRAQNNIQNVAITIHLNKR